MLQQDQTSYGPVLDWNPYSWLTFRADYQHAHRSSPGYNNNRADLVQVLGDSPGTIAELQDLRRFDEATLDVNQTSLFASVQPIENLTLFTAFNYDDYNYPASDFGLQHTSSYSPSGGPVGIRFQACTFLATTHGRRTIGTSGRFTEVPLVV